MFTSSSRYLDILRWGRYQGEYLIDEFSTGTTIEYGTPSELLASRDQAGTDVVTALQTVVDTENGVHYVSNSGTITFKARRSRYNDDTPVVSVR